MTEEQLLEDNLGSVQGKLIITRKLLKYRLAFAVRFCRLYAALFRQFFTPFIISHLPFMNANLHTSIIYWELLF